MRHLNIDTEWINISSVNLECASNDIGILLISFISKIEFIVIFQVVFFRLKVKYMYKGY
jgi:hypothetical protein